MNLWGPSRHRVYQVRTLGLCDTSQRSEMSGLSMTNCMQQVLIEDLLYARQSLLGKRIHRWPGMTVNRKDKYT